MNLDHTMSCLNEHTRSICTIFNALEKQTKFNKILLVGCGYLLYKVLKTSSTNKKQDEQIAELTKKINKMSSEKETGECNA